MRSSIILILFIPFAFSFEYDDDPEYKRYKAAYDYVVNSAALDSFCTFYEIPDSARTFCLSKMLESFTNSIFLFEIIEYEFGMELPDNPSQLNYDNPEYIRYKTIRDSLILSEDSSYIVEYIDFSGINNNEMDCNFKIYFSKIDKDRIIIEMPFGYRNYHVHDVENVNKNSYIGMTHLIYFTPGSDSIRKAFSYSYAK